MLTISSLYRGGGGDFVLPNVSYVEGTNKVFYHPVPPPTYVGDIVYKSNGKLNTINYEEWTSSLGTPVGVVVVPSGFAPDGKTRMMSLQRANVNYQQWTNSAADTRLTNHNRVPTTDNAGSTTTGSNSSGYLPSDMFTGSTSYVDPLANYYSTSYTPYIPSPYLGDKPNPAYYAEISGYKNALSDFNGKGNTDVLVGLGSSYVAANTARNYKVEGAEEIEWYLPGMGELGYIMPRLNKIQAALAKVNAPQLESSSHHWSSTEYPGNSGFGISMAYGLSMYDAHVMNYGANSDKGNIRPFALLG